MTPAELADAVEAVVESCKSRVLGVGAEQYSDGDQQRFEVLPIDDLFVWASEELQDIVVYAVMLELRLERLRVAVAKNLP